MLMNIMKRKEKLKHVFFFQFEIHRYPLLLLQQTKLRTKKNKRKYTNSVIFTNFRLSLTTIKMLNQQLRLPFSPVIFIAYIFVMEEWEIRFYTFYNTSLVLVTEFPSFTSCLGNKKNSFFVSVSLYFYRKKNFNLNCCNTQKI